LRAITDKNIDNTFKYLLFDADKGPFSISARKQFKSNYIAMCNFICVFQKNHKLMKCLWQEVYVLHKMFSVVLCCFGYDAPTADAMQLLGKRHHVVLLALCHSYMNNNGWFVGLRIFIDSDILCLLLKFVVSTVV
jgi:hypothetical protein